PRQLVPQRRRWKIPLARLRRERPCAEVDPRARRGPWRRPGNAHWLRAGEERPHARRTENFRRSAKRIAPRGSRRLGKRAGRFEAVPDEIRPTPAARNSRGARQTREALPPRRHRVVAQPPRKN